jgi:hypothetical protein
MVDPVLVPLFVAVFAIEGREPLDSEEVDEDLDRWILKVLSRAR